MGRAPRLDIPGSPQHLVQRGVDRRACFARDWDYARYLDELGLRPEARVEVLAIAPFEGPLTLAIDGREQAIGRALAALIRVREAGAAAAADSPRPAR